MGLLFFPPLVIFQTTCAVSVPPQMNSPVSATDDDRESHLTVSWQPLDDSFDVTAYVLQVRDSFGYVLLHITCFFYTPTHNFLTDAYL